MRQIDAIHRADVTPSPASRALLVDLHAACRGVAGRYVRPLARTA
jgi:hypothetical protein